MKTRSGHIGVISNHKGGTGKTVTSVNLGAALSLEGFMSPQLRLDIQHFRSTGVVLERLEKRLRIFRSTGDTHA